MSHQSTGFKSEQEAAAGDAMLLAIVGGLNLYALWPRDISAKKVIIIEEPAEEQEKVIAGDQA